MTAQQRAVQQALLSGAPPRQSPQAPAETAAIPTCTATWPGGGRCPLPAAKLGLCVAHYQRQRRGGRPGPVRPHQMAGGKQRSMYVPAELWCEMGRRARAQGLSLSEHLRRTVARALREEDVRLAQAARDEAVQAVLLVPAEAPAEAKRAAAEQAASRGRP